MRWNPTARVIRVTLTRREDLGPGTTVLGIVGWPLGVSDLMCPRGNESRLVDFGN